MQEKSKQEQLANALCGVLFCAACLPAFFPKPSEEELELFEIGAPNEQSTDRYMMAVQNEDDLHTSLLAYVPVAALREGIERALCSIWDDDDAVSKKLTALRAKLDNMEKNSTTAKETK